MFLHEGSPSTMNGSKWTFLCAFSCVAALTVVSCPSRPKAPDRPPNVLFMSLDTLRADHLGIYGYHRDTSPFLDLVAQEGIVFERAIAQSPHTYDSHKSLFQSRYPGRFDDAGTVLADVLRQHGYYTAGFTGGGFVAASFGFDKGFDLYREYPKGLRDSLPDLRSWLVQEAPTRAPYFVFLHTYDVHVPYQPLPLFGELYDRGYAGPVVPELTSIFQRQYLGLNPPDERFLAIEWNEADRRRYEALYDSEIRQADAALRGFFNFLGSCPAWDWERDILVIFSDHGEEFWEHGAIGHGMTLHDELIRVPLVIRLPGAEAGGLRIDRTVELMDLGPTILELVGAQPPADFRGASLVPLFRNPEEGKRIDPRNRVAVSLTVKGQFSVIRYPWKLIQKAEEGTVELFNLAVDPREQHSVSDEHPDIVASLGRILSETLSDVGAKASYLIDPGAVEDPELREQLRALGYLE